MSIPSFGMELRSICITISSFGIEVRSTCITISSFGIEVRSACIPTSSFGIERCGSLVSFGDKLAGQPTACRNGLGVY
ncbi:hypothetical protein BC936DRAFT_145751 [Jimgerdemannia flammicorona]|uniref:Uncharacterized protein n=1 Tax=Jimgerdemannia flammicorona TaxID=994334 RepID=A0A433D9B0_9FUNG|nr:hypothetical protein BC936DRAFT_145751 [Jimgerdemannia flammicorona]